MIGIAYFYAFWALISFLVLGGVLGLTSIWVPGFWDSELGQKLFYTDVFLTVTCIIIAVVLKFSI